jgi:membrane-associated phospholipid phosphatase
VLDWNDTLLNAVSTTSMNPPAASRAMAMMHTAVYDAVNSVNPTRRGYYRVYDNPAGTSAEAAAAVAAHGVLYQLFPSRRPQLDSALAASLDAITDGPGKAAGITLGGQSAAGILSLRSNDNSSLVVPYTPGTGVGQWRPTPPGYANALLPNWKYLTPFAMSSGSQFRPPAPPSVGSPEYTAAYNEVKSLGGVGSLTRTTEQSDIALMWAAGGGTVTPPGQWNQIAAQVAQARGNTMEENARLFALLGLGLADAAVVAWDCKYTFDYWRPITGINEGDTDGNPDTAGDASFIPLLASPPFPAYISGHSTFSSSGATILADFFGSDSAAFTVTSAGITRSFTSFQTAAEEAGQSRIYGGIHWQFDNQMGLACGQEVGTLVGDTMLLVPAPGGAALMGIAGLAVVRRRR